MRADAERSAARILEAAATVLATDPNASLERIADAAGLARATVHRRFASRQALLGALVDQLNERYLISLTQARVETAPPVVALHRVAEAVFALKISHRFVMDLTADPDNCLTALSPEVVGRLDTLFTRLHEAGAITAARPAWCREVFLVLLDAVHRQPPDAPELAPGNGDPGSRADLFARTLLGALGGTP
ncbi:TetR/AcrR family transcriptional regulator [Actinoplanes couchii]|uniref:TetR family transcriptional regulator n=1 Tax=Actinoplanes couchii TaxID=403638 RepID=A0ABQ3XTL2_9ACTN|nr:TetR/AcrR family transcriptional regulator [Actinoplanes couchii]MDR6318926.1 AcrR family transcriptional regulator [Actinoplanes couchii]GID61834.1 TetR family transcriptional regulator [Actinoplanes couchii]